MSPRKNSNEPTPGEEDKNDIHPQPEVHSKVRRESASSYSLPSHGLPTPPDGGWGWVVVFGSFMIHVIADGVAYSFGVFLPTFLEYFNLGRSETGWLGSLMIGVTWGTGPIGSIFTNKFGCRATTIIGSVVAGVAFIISLFAPNIWFMYFSFGILAGLGLGLIYLPAIVIVTFYFEKKRAFATGLAVCGSGIGTFIFAPLAQVLLDEYGWKGAVLIVAGLIFNCIICGALFRPLKADEPPKIQSSDGEEMETLSSDGQKVSKASNGHANMQEAALSTSTTSLPQHALLNSHRERSAQDPSGVRAFSSDMWLHKPDQANEKSSTQQSHGGAVSPLARKDALYGASLQNIPLYRSNPALYTRSMASLPREISEKGVKTTACQDIMAYLSLLKDPVYFLFVVSNFLTSLGFCVPYIYLPDLAIQQGVSPAKAAFLISVIGIANTIGRVVFGWMSDRKCVNRLFLYNTVLTLCGLSTALSSFCYIYPMLVVYAAAFGLFIGVYVGLTSVVLVDLLGLDKLTNAFGLVLLFQGTAAVIGPPIAGKMYDVRGSYDDAFYLMGAMIALSGLMLFFIPCIQAWQGKGPKAKQDPSLQREIDLGKKVSGSISYLPVPDKAGDTAC